MRILTQQLWGQQEALHFQGCWARVWSGDGGDGRVVTELPWALN